MTPTLGSHFDAWVDDYDTALAQGLSISGEDREHFARGRIGWLASRLRELGEHPRSILDFGCGTGFSTPILAELLGATRVVGTDVSVKSIEAAARRHRSPGIRFIPLARYRPNGEIDVAYCNGVFHHIPEDQRADLVQFARRALRPAGLFAFWENNPWNPGTRLAMKRIPFDRDAVMLSARQARRLLSGSGFEIVRTDFLFVFPRPLRFLRRWEPRLTHWPLGAQYQILCRKRPEHA